MFEQSEYLRSNDINNLYEILTGKKSNANISYSRPPKLSDQQKETIIKAIEKIQDVAKDNDLEPGLLATTRELKHLISYKTSDRLLARWRKQLLKEVYQEFELKLN